jgi:hypothetical protein
VGEADEDLAGKIGNVRPRLAGCAVEREHVTEAVVVVQAVGDLKVPSAH